MKKLLTLLYDENATEAERDDAIIDLGDSDDIEIEQSLVDATKKITLSDMLLASIGEALANIWIRKNKINFDHLEQLPFIAKDEAICCIKNIKPTLLKDHWNERRN